MISRFIKWLRLALSARRLNAHLAAENLALRQQLGMYKRQEKMPRFTQREGPRGFLARVSDGSQGMRSREDSRQILGGSRGRIGPAKLIPYPPLLLPVQHRGDGPEGV